MAEASDPPTKNFLLKPEDIRRLIKHDDACLATDRIVVDGAPVGWMYREESNHEVDSGWRFMAGDESEEYMANPDNVGIYALNSLANYDEDIIHFLDRPVGSAFERTGPDQPLQPVAPLDDLHPEYPVESGTYQLTEAWTIELPGEFNRRIEDEAMVLWRPGLTLHIVAWDNTNDESVEDRLEQLLGSVAPNADDIQRADGDDLTRLSWAVDEMAVDGPATSVHGFAINESGQILASAYFEAPGTAEEARAAINSISPIG